MSTKFKFRVRAGSHFLEDGREMTEGKIFSSDKPLHEIFQNKFDLITSRADDKEIDEDPDVNPLVEKTTFFPIASMKGLRVFRNRKTKQWEIQSADGVVVHKNLAKDEVEGLLEEDVEDEVEDVETKKKKKTAKK